MRGWRRDETLRALWQVDRTAEPAAEVLQFDLQKRGLEETMSRLFDNFPLPWTIKQSEWVNPDKHLGGFEVFDATGAVVIRGGSYTGDSDAEFNLDRLQVAELVAIVNAAGGK